MIDDEEIWMWRQVVDIRYLSVLTDINDKFPTEHIFPEPTLAMDTESNCDRVPSGLPTVYQEYG